MEDILFIEVREGGQIHFVISVILSTLETITVFFLMITMHRYKHKPEYIMISLFAVILAILSYIMRVKLQLPRFDIPVQWSLMFLFVRYMFGVRGFYSALMVMSGAILYALLQSVLVLAASELGMFSFSDSQSETSDGAHRIQLVSILIGVGLVQLMKRFNLGFSFVPYHLKADVKLSGVNKRMMWSMVFIGLIIAVSIISMSTHSTYLFCTSAVLMLLSFIDLMRLSYTKEYEDD